MKKTIGHMLQKETERAKGEITKVPEEKGEQNFDCTL